MAQPCAACGGEKAPGPGQKYCALCKTVQGSLVERERAARDRMRTGTAKGDLAANRARALAAPRGQFWCGGCVRYLPLRSQSSVKSRCKPCFRAAAHSARLLKVYGITADQYDALLKAQDDACAICGNKPRSMRLAVDHDHYTGEIRGLLCKRCNKTLLGAAGHDPRILRRAARYLNRPPAQAVLPSGHVVPEIN